MLRYIDILCHSDEEGFLLEIKTKVFDYQTRKRIINYIPVLQDSIEKFIRFLQKISESYMNSWKWVINLLLLIIITDMRVLLADYPGLIPERLIEKQIG